MPESQESNVTASNTSNVATVSSVAQPVDTTPKAPVENKVYSPETDNQFSAAEMEALINKAKEPKVETPIENKEAPKETPVETPKENTNAEVKKEGVQEVKPEVKPNDDIRKVISEVLEEKFKGLGVKEESIDKAEENFFGFGSQEALDKAYADDMSGTTKKILQESVKDIVANAIKEQIEPFKKQIAPVTDKIQNEQIAQHQKEAQDLVPELKDPNSLMSKDYNSFITDKSNHDLINNWASKGKNPLVEVAKLIRAERINDYVSQAKQQGFKEGEEKALKAGRASVEGGGKPTSDENISMEKFDKMSSAEQEKYLISKGAFKTR